MSGHYRAMLTSALDPFELEFISTAWRRVAIRCIIAKNGRMTLSYQAGIGMYLAIIQIVTVTDVLCSSGWRVHKTSSIEL